MDINKVGAVKKIFRNQKIIVVLCGMFLLTLSGCVTSEEREELDKLEVELDNAINDLEKSLEDLETWNSCMEMYDYDPPEGMCE